MGGLEAPVIGCLFSNLAAACWDSLAVCALSHPLAATRTRVPSALAAARDAAAVVRENGDDRDCGRLCWGGEGEEGRVVGVGMTMLSWRKVSWRATFGATDPAKSLVSLSDLTLDSLTLARRSLSSSCAWTSWRNKNQVV